MTRRSSTRSTPRTSVGKCGSIRAHCWSLSQNRFLLINPSPNTNQSRIVDAKRLMSSDPSQSVALVAEHGTSRRRRRQRSPQELEYQFHSLLPPSGIKGGFKRPANQEAKPVPSPVRRQTAAQTSLTQHTVHLLSTASRPTSQ